MEGARSKAETGDYTSADFAAWLGIAAFFLMAISIGAMLMLGTGIPFLGRGMLILGMTSAGAYLEQHGFSAQLADVMDFGHASPAMAIAFLLGLAAVIVGLIAIIRKHKLPPAIRERKMVQAVIGISFGLGGGLWPIWLPFVILALPR
jgi:hypothetical protein